MKIMATFDGSEFSEEILPLLERLAALPGAEFVLFSSSEDPEGRRDAEAIAPAQAVGMTHASQPMVVEQPEPGTAETKEQAVERRLAQMRDYLIGLAGRLPAGTPSRALADIDDDPARAIVRHAEREGVDVIVIATHGRTGMVRALLGSVAERVVRAGVAPVLLVRPKAGA
jgi:nucleotide-binding universal stress UspA family protein